MKILESQSATLSNPEVVAHLASLRAKKQQARATSTQPVAGIQNLETVLKELTEYLSNPSSPLALPSTSNNPRTTIRALILALKTYALTKAELLMILNLQPRDLGLLDCVVEECDLRFGEEEQERILAVVEEVLGPGGGFKVGEGNGTNGEEGGG